MMSLRWLLVPFLVARQHSGTLMTHGIILEKTHVFFVFPGITRANTKPHTKRLKRKMTRKHEEHDMQCAFIAAARKLPGCEWIHAIPNAMPGNVVSQVWMKREGRLAGVLDVFLPRACGRFHGLYPEFKAGKNGLTEEQARFILYADSAGYAVAVCRSAQAGIDTVLRYLRGEHSNEAAMQEARAVLTPRVIVGAETGPKRRPMNLDWVRSVRDQCSSADVPFWFNQDSDRNKTLDGVEHHPEFWK